MRAPTTVFDSGWDRVGVAAMQWSSFNGSQVEALAQGPSFLAEPRQRDCPACGERAVRAYVTTPPAARRPTLVSYAWCAVCRRFVGTRTARPAGLTFGDPLAGLSVAERRKVEGSLVGFLTHLNTLWDDGTLPQVFTVTEH
ncbi:MAG TPA: hypothetical protein VFO77_14745 [Actinoplanes sp.]|nr:hypothetical protein [Actinoplanes sp.]